MSNNDREEEHRRKMFFITSWASIVFAAIVLVFLVLWASVIGPGDPIITNHFTVVIGLPMAAVGAFILVSVLRQQHGPVEFEGLGFKLKGGSGPIILWVICFLAIAGAIKLLI